MPPEIPDTDIEIVAQRTGVEREVAKRALAQVDGDLAAAVERIESNEDSTPDEDKSFEERVEEIRRQREQERLEQLDDRGGNDPPSAHAADPDESTVGASVADTPESQVPSAEAVASPPRRRLSRIKTS